MRGTVGVGSSPQRDSPCELLNNIIWSCETMTVDVRVRYSYRPIFCDERATHNSSSKLRRGFLKEMLHFTPFLWNNNRRRDDVQDVEGYSEDVEVRSRGIVEGFSRGV